MARIGTATRKTGEVDIIVELDLDPEPPVEYSISISAESGETGVDPAMWEHFCNQLYRFAGFAGTIAAHGDYPHHVIEDVAISFGRAFNNALGDRAGVWRTASHIMPMEGLVVTVAVDLSGRPWARLDLPEEKSPLLEMLRHWLSAMAAHGGFDLFVRIDWSSGTVQLDHHAVETVAKALGRVLHLATRVTYGEVLSIKGSLTP